MNNKPVAYAMFRDGEYYDAIHPDEQAKTVGEYDIPLYTHPVKELDEQFKKGFEAGKEEGWKAHKFHHPVKTLTDEEIISEWIGCERNYYNFARAILKKAQQK
jgi:hypothetical protein